MKKNNTLKSSVIAILTTLALAGSAYGQILVTDTFENRATGSNVNGTATSGPNNPNAWYWNAFGGVVAEDDGNKYNDLSGIATSLGTFSTNIYSPGRVALSSTNEYKLSYDLLWLETWGGSSATHGIQVFFNQSDTWTGPSSTAQGYVFSVWASDINTASYKLYQRIGEAVDDLAAGTFSFDGLIDTTNDTTPGNALPIELTWQGNEISFSLNSQTIFDSATTPFTPNTQNTELSSSTYFSFFSSDHRDKGIDNVTLAAIPELSSSSLFMGIGALFCGFIARRKKA